MNLWVLLTVCFHASSLLATMQNRYRDAHFIDEDAEPREGSPAQSHAPAECPS